MMKRILACLLCLVLLCAAGLPLARAEMDTNDAAGRVDALLGGILAYQLERTGSADIQAWINGELVQNAGAGSEWNVFALSRMGDYDLTSYCEALRAYVQNAGTLSASTRQKYALAFLAAGESNDFVQKTASESIGAQGVMSWIYGLHLLNNGIDGSLTAQQTVEALLKLRLADGGWALRGEVSDVDVTCMALQALAPHSGDEAVKEAVWQAVGMLSSRQMAEGDFASFGAANPESAAQVVIALAELGVNAFEDERFIKNGFTLLDVIERFRLEDGSFCHALGGAANANAATQVMQALIAWQRMMDGREGLYHLEAQETASPQMKTELGYKPVAAMVIAGLALIVCIVLLILKKRSFKNVLAVLVIACALIAFVMTTDFQSAEGYYTGQAVVKHNPIGQITMSIRCDLALGKTDVDLPKDGVMLGETAFAIAQGDTPYTILTEAARTYGIRLDTSGPQGMIYVTGINHLYEFACGELSGWNYLINGKTADTGCDQYALKDGDVIEWRYTCELGNDLK